jgi:predicted RNA-binding protein with TRAM domain
LRIQGSTVQVEPVGRKSTGQHAAEGFCIYHGGVENLGDVVAAKDLGRLITSSIATR